MKPNQKIGILLFLLVSIFRTQAQMAGSFSVPATFPTIAAAINSLNLVGVSAPVTIHISAGHTETAVAGGYKLFTVSGASAGNQVFFQKSGAGANPIIYAPSGGTATPASARQDGVWCLVGADYITIDGIDIIDPNTSNPATMEYGYGMYNANPDNGCQHNTIKNCSITLTTINNVVGTGPVGGGTRGIDIVSASYTANLTYLTYTSSSSPHVDNRIYSNTIQFCTIGIHLSGISGSPFVCDANDIGGSSAVTGNTVTNFGSSNTSLGSCAIKAIWSTALNVSNNVINNNTGAGPTVTSKVYGIWCNTYSSSTTLVDHNTITLSKAGSNGGELLGVFSDYMNSSSTVQVTSNTFPSFTFSAGATSFASVIYNKSSIASSVHISGNSIQNVFVDIPGNLEIISSTPGNGMCSILSNTISNVSCSVTALNDIYFAGYMHFISGNLVESITTDAPHAGIINENTASMSTTITGNIMRNIASSNFTACSSVNSALAAKEISNNQFYNISSLPSTTAGLNFVGIDLAGSATTSTLSGNGIYSVSSTGPGNPATLTGIRIANNCITSRNKVAALYSDGTGSIVGIQALSSGDHTLDNNLVGDLQVTGSSLPDAISGISISGYPSSLYFNSVHLNATSSGANFGTSALILTGTGTLTSRNNIFVNTSTPTGTALTCAIRKATAANIPLSANSNNNLLYAGAAASNQVIYLGNTTTYSTLTLYKTLMSPKEALSVSENPPFLTTNGSAGNFLSINPGIPTQVEAQALPLGGTYTLDYNGTTRHASTPDIGAWEGNYTPGDLLPPVILSAGFIEPECNAGGRTYTVNFSDQTGVASGTVAPRLYYRVNVAPYTSVQGSLTAGTATNGVWTFSMAYSAAPSDVIHYFIAVQDLSPLNNFTMSPSTGGIAVEVNTIQVAPSPANTFTMGTPPTISVLSGSICNGQSFTLNPAGAATYSYSGGASVVNPTINTTYSITGRDAFGCLASNVAIASITVNATPTIAVTGGSICSGQAFTFSPTGADTYLYSGGSAVVSPLTNSAYTITGTNTLGGCVSDPVTANVDVFITPTVSVNSGTICAGDPFTLVPSGADLYTISGGSAVVSPATSTIYLVSGSSNEGCASANTATANITVGPLPTISVNSGSICSGKSFTLLASGADTYSYSSGSDVISPLTNTLYTVTGTSSLGCASSNTAIASVTVEASPVITVNSGSICSGQTFILVPSDVSLTYTYSGGSASVSPGATTSFTVAGSNSFGCISNIATSEVTVSPSPTVSVNSGSTCAGNTFTIVPSGADLYTISGGSWIVSPATTSVYLVSGSSSEGCASANTATVTVIVAPLPTISVNSGSVCSGKSFTLVASGADTYSYSGGSDVVSPLTNTTYTVTGSSASGCASSNTAIASVTVEASPVITVNSGSICSGQTFTLVPSDVSLTYTYSGGSAFVSPGTSTSFTVAGSNSLGCVSNIATSNLTVSPSPTLSVNSGSICAGNTFTIVPSGADLYMISGGSATVSPSTNSIYLVSGTSNAGCASVNTATATITVAPLPTVSVNSGSVCSGKSFTLIASGAHTYNYSGGSIVSPSTNTVYTVTGTSSVGCASSNTATASITVAPSPTITVNSGSICAGKTFTILPSDGSLTYTYSGGSAMVSPATTTFYTVSGSNALGCISNSVVANVTVSANPTLSVNSGSICSGNTFTILPSGASSYSVQGNSYTVSPASSSNYTVTGLSAEGCAAVNTVTASVTVYTLPIVSVGSGSICSGEVFTLTATGASTYVYSSGSATVSPVNTSTYAVTGLSADGCASSNTAIATVSVNSLPAVSISGSTLICEGETSTLTASGADTYTWMSTGNGSVFIASPGISTTYSVIGQSVNSCSQSAQITVSVNSLPTVAVSGATAICNGSSVSLTANGTAVTFTWSDGGATGGTAVFSPILTTVYTVTGTASNSCINTATYQVLVNALPPVQANADNTSICLGEAVTLSGSGANTYTWSGSVINNTSFTPNTTATYTVTGTGAGSCSKSATIQIVVHSLPNINITSNSPDTICAGTEVILSADGGNLYSWSPGQNTTSISVTPLVTTVYTVTGTDINECKSTASFTQVVSECTSIMELPGTSPNIRVYPNPGSGLFTIETDQLEGDERIEVSNSLGAVIFTGRISTLSSGLELTEYARGIYLLRIYSGIKLLKQEKIILAQ